MQGVGSAWPSPAPSKGKTINLSLAALRISKTDIWLLGLKLFPSPNGSTTPQNLGLGQSRKVHQAALGPFCAGFIGHPKG